MSVNRSTPGGLLALLVLLGCPGGDKESAAPEVCADGAQIYVAGTPTGECGTECPEGSFKAYQDGDLLVCHDCLEDTDCDTGQTCSSNCGPGCEDDEGGCCAVNTCESMEG